MSDFKPGDVVEVWTTFSVPSCVASRAEPEPEMATCVMCGETEPAFSYAWMPGAVPRVHRGICRNAQVRCRPLTDEERAHLRGDAYDGLPAPEPVCHQRYAERIECNLASHEELAGRVTVLESDKRELEIENSRLRREVERLGRKR